MTNIKQFVAGLFLKFGGQVNLTGLDTIHFANLERKPNHPIRVVRRNGSVQTYRAGDERLGGNISKDYDSSLRRVLSSGSYADKRTGFHI